MSLLSIISGEGESAAVLCNLAPPSSVIGSNDANVPMLLRLAQREGAELARRHDWQALTVTHTMTTLGTEIQDVFPTGFNRFIPYPELWNRTTLQKYSGPTDARKWNQLISSGVTAGSPGWWRVLGGRINIYPAPTAGETLAFEYITSAWVTAVDGITHKFLFSVDTDTARVPERLIVLGVVWRWKQTKGFDYAEDLATYERAVELACSRDRAIGIIQLASRGAGSHDDTGTASWTGTVTP